MQRALIIALFVLLAISHIAVVNTLTRQHVELRKIERQNQLFILPSSILKVASLDYKGVISDFLFIKGIVYIGGSVAEGRAGKLKINESQWHEFYNFMDVSSDLDPYFQDPYYLANAFLTWDAGMIHEVNTLLSKGSRSRTWDWSLPFFAGFNYFYFLNDNDNASKWLMEASRRPGASPVLASLASKLAFKANRTDSSISFLEEMIKRTDDESMKELFEKRVDVFKAILALEKALDTYQKQFRIKPSDLKELVKKRIIAEIPREPYGGKFYIDSGGNVRTSSESQLMPFRKN
jgi:hypothetical protein